MSPDQVKERLRGRSIDDLLDELASSCRHIATTEAMFAGGPIPQYEFISYDVFRRELPLVVAEIRRRASPPEARADAQRYYRVGPIALTASPLSPEAQEPKT